MQDHRWKSPQIVFGDEDMCRILSQDFSIFSRVHIEHFGELDERDVDSDSDETITNNNNHHFTKVDVIFASANS